MVLRMWLLFGLLGGVAALSASDMFVKARFDDDEDAPSTDDDDADAESPSLTTSGSNLLVGMWDDDTSDPLPDAPSTPPPCGRSWNGPVR
jgi:hypothetical protein